MKTPRILRYIKPKPKVKKLPTFTRIRATQSLGIRGGVFTEGNEYQVDSVCWFDHWSGETKLRVFAINNYGTSSILTEGDWWDYFTIIE